MVASNHMNFRLRGIPLEYETRNEVCSLIQNTLGLELSASPTVYSLALSPSDQNNKIATISFPSIPESLSDRSRDEWVFPLSEGNDFDFGRSLVFDTHFAGFTPFQRTSDQDCHIDVIVVCGLGGHALGSFKERNGRFVWIRDALPSDIPNARVLTYGYNTQLVESKSFQSLTDLGRALQVDLEGIRDPSQPRSILFIGHSLGGLVIKETVRILNEEPLEADLPVLDAISGFAFFGVPHRGLAVECLVPLVKDNPNRGLLESLNKNSPLLERLQVEFDKISQARGFSIVSFYETERSPTAAWVNGKWEMSGPSEVLVEVLSATCGCRKQHPINRNHSEMVKYSGVHDQLYRRVFIVLRPILRITRGRTGTVGIGDGSQVSVQISGDEQECLRSLSFPEQEHRYSEVSYAHNTCEWLLEYPQYQAWMNKPQGLFWVKGCPGTGKSVLMKFAVDMMSRRKSGELVVSFFIHGRGVPLQRTPLGMLRALLNSLLRSFPTYLTELTERFQDQQQRYGSYEQKNGWCWNEKELEKLLSRLLIKGTKDHPVVIFIDALDECGEEDAKSLLVSFKSLIGNAEREGSLLKICFSSRHFPILGHETIPRVYVEEKNDKDIRVVIEDRLRELQPDEKRHQIENEILLKAHGGFQWAILITNIILDGDAIGTRTEDLLSMVSSIPPDLDELYEVILKEATEDKHKQMTKLFQWVLFAERPLSAQELREALATDKDMAYTTVSQLRSHGDWSDSVSRFETRVRYISRGLVEFQDRDVYEQYEPGGEEWNREAQFIHQSAADFVSQRFLAHTNGESIQGSSTSSGHYQISRSLFRYIKLEEILGSGGLSRKKLSATFPLMPYVVTFLFYHVKFIEKAGIPQTDLIALIHGDQPENLKMLAGIWRIMDPESTHAPWGWPFVGATDLHRAIALGSATLLGLLLQKDISDLDARDFDGNTPLQLALREDREELALMILDRSRACRSEHGAVISTDRPGSLDVERQKYLAHVNSTNDDGDTPLGVAVSIRADKAIRSLIKAGAEVKHEKSLVFYAIIEEDRELISWLIEKEADLKGAVYFAIRCMDGTNHDDVLHIHLKDLLKASPGTNRFVGFEVDDFIEADESADEDVDPDEEAIFLASRNGRTEVVDLLLSHGSSAMLEDKDGDVPLWSAIGNHHWETAEVLYRAAPQAIQVRNAPHILEAMKDGDLEFVVFFVEVGDGLLTYQQVFYDAVKTDAVLFVKAFLQADENNIQLANQIYEGCETPFHMAVREKFYGMVEILLDTGKVDINLRNADGKTPFHLAVEGGDIGMVSMLLESTKVEISEEDGEGYTPFLRAIVQDQRDLVKLLLNQIELDINKTDRMGETPFWWALKFRRLEVARLLHSTGRVNMYIRNQKGQCLLGWALIFRSSELYYIYQ